MTDYHTTAVKTNQKRRYKWTGGGLFSRTAGRLVEGTLLMTGDLTLSEAWPEATPPPSCCNRDGQKAF